MGLAEYLVARHDHLEARIEAIVHLFGDLDMFHFEILQDSRLKTAIGTVRGTAGAPGLLTILFAIWTNLPALESVINDPVALVAEILKILNVVPLAPVPIAPAAH